MKFKPDAELRALWDQYGDQGKMKLPGGQSLPRGKSALLSLAYSAC
jgi:hypothetical protein